MQKATEAIFETMLGMRVEALSYRVDPEPSSSSSGMLSLIGFTGGWLGTGSIHCSPALACRIADALFLTEHAVVDDEVMDAMAETTNIILGNVKTELENDLGPMSLSIPTVIYGRNFVKRSLAKRDWVVAPFVCDAEHFEVHLCLTENSNPSPESATQSLPYSLHV